MPNFAEGDNAFMGLFGDVPNKGAETSRVEEPPKQDESHVSEEQTSKVNNGESGNKPVEEVATETPVRRRGRKKKTVADCDGGSTVEVGHFSCICDSKLIDKVRALAWKEHMTVRAVVEKMFSTCISKYEKKHGVIEVEQTKSTDELF